MSYIVFWTESVEKEQVLIVNHLMAVVAKIKRLATIGGKANLVLTVKRELNGQSVLFVSSDVWNVVKNLELLLIAQAEFHFQRLGSTAEIIVNQHQPIVDAAPVAIIEKGAQVAVGLLKNQIRPPVPPLLEHYKHLLLMPVQINQTDCNIIK